MVAVTLVFLIALFFGIDGAFVGYNCGYDEGWETAIECFEREVENGIQSKNRE